MKKYQRCTRCIMDNYSDEYISFNDEGYCNYCVDAIERKAYTYFPNELGNNKLNSLLEDIKKSGRNNKFDCIMGISGGLDSSYLALLGMKWGLRILAVHIDDGFDTPIAKKNIKNLCAKCGFDLQMIVPDSEQFRDLTRAYILAEVPNLAVPQDNILFAAIYKLMRTYNIKYFLSGSNYALECILQEGNTYTSMDVKNIKAIHKRFGRGKIDKLSFLSNNRRIIDRFFHGIKTVKPLNYIDYNKERAITELKDFCDFHYYEAKHLENTLTKFIQLYWFYHKFSVDKRTSHLSSLIISNQMTREEALIEISKPIYDKKSMELDKEFILKQFSISLETFDEIMHRKGHQHTDYLHSKKSILSFFGEMNLIRRLKTYLQS